MILSTYHNGNTVKNMAIAQGNYASQLKAFLMLEFFSLFLKNSQNVNDIKSKKKEFNIWLLVKKFTNKFNKDKNYKYFLLK